jgi:hypothetical protein
MHLSQFHSSNVEISIQRDVNLNKIQEQSKVNAVRLGVKVSSHAQKRVGGESVMAFGGQIMEDEKQGQKRNFKNEIIVNQKNSKSQANALTLQHQFTKKVLPLPSVSKITHENWHQEEFRDDRSMISSIKVKDHN